MQELGEWNEWRDDIESWVRRSSEILHSLTHPGLLHFVGVHGTVPEPRALIAVADHITYYGIFQQQVVHVRAIPPPPPGVLDLEIHDGEEFSPDKLRANVERLYLTVVRMRLVLHAPGS